MIKKVAFTAALLLFLGVGYAQKLTRASCLENADMRYNQCINAGTPFTECMDQYETRVAFCNTIPPC